MTGLRLGHNETTTSGVFLASEIVFVEGRGGEGSGFADQSASQDS